MPKKQIQSIEHIKRNFQMVQHKVRYDEDNYHCEIFKYDRTNEAFYTAESLELKTSNSVKAISHGIDTSYLISERGFKIVTNDLNNGLPEEKPLIITNQFKAKNTGNYRLDLLYRAYSSDLDKITPVIECYIDGELQKNTTPVFVNPFMFSRLQHHTELTEGTHTIEYHVNSRVKVFALSIREYQMYTGSKSSHDDLIIKTCKITLSETLKPDELEMTLIYYNELKEDKELTTDKRNRSGYLFDYRDEINFYCVDKTGKEQQVFGGYISSVSVDDDLTTMTLNCGGRLMDGDKRPLMSQIALLGGTEENTEYETYKEMHQFFNTRGEILKYLTGAYEIPLIHSNIDNNADFNQKFTHKFVYAKNQENSIDIDNNPNHEDWNITELIRVAHLTDSIQIRNGIKLDDTLSALDANKAIQEVKIYDSNQKGLIEISPNTSQNLWLEYGLGEPEYTIKVKQDSGEERVESYGFATYNQKLLADTITSEVGYAAVEPIYKYFCTACVYPSPVYRNRQKDTDAMARTILDTGSVYCNCCDRAALLANVLAYKGVPEIYYAHGDNHVWIRLKNYMTLPSQEIDLDPNYSRPEMGKVYHDLTPYNLRLYPTSSDWDVY